MTQPHVLIVPGLNGSGPDHWQTVWEDERIDCTRIEQSSWVEPDPLLWMCKIDATIAAHSGPVVIVAHSLGCLAVAAWATLAQLDPKRAIAAMLVAPCDPGQESACEQIRRFGLIAKSRLPISSVLVASADDPYATFSRSSSFAALWGSRLVDAGEVGHINAKSNLGSWQWGQTILDQLIASVAPHERSLNRLSLFA